ncbi:ABC transporter ATP-binding protein [Sedimentibacter sp. zth1]|uniref:ABC transporter ATP-binding protein n=1 Tax=Sedimentibacter sp. zth1 TaxID=2816908 RepID=UPI001A9396EE|nr:ABC transporter ATP-binding protein [Sedimentibacter sp. zth1]QSX05342.1 ABC transporter ATP-binding protein [Sedimentibacter sp. zth1]
MKKDSSKSFRKDLKIIIHFLKLTQKINKSYVPTLITAALFKALTPLVNIIMPKFIIDELLMDMRIDFLVMLVAITVVSNLILNIINRCFAKFIAVKDLEISNGFDLLIGKKVMNLDFEQIEDPEVLNLKELAVFPVRDQGTIQFMVQDIMKLFTQCISIITLGAVLITLSPILVIFIIVMVLFNTYIFNRIQKTQYKMNQDIIIFNREYVYLYNIGDDFALGKDVRLYNMSPLIVNKLLKYNDKLLNVFNKGNIKIGKYEGMNKVNFQLQTFGTYGYLVYRLLTGLGIGNFTMYANTTLNFSTAIADCLSCYVGISQKCRYLELYLEFEGLKSKKSIGEEATKSISDFTIEFKNVGFKYPRSKNYTLKNINITIKPEEKLSVVGLNGAGKTTFIKLLCRLYEVTEGEILLNGVNIQKYDYDEYMDLLSVVFQDFKLFAFTLKENVGLLGWDNIDDKEIKGVIEKAGLGNDLNKLSKGIYTTVYKIFDKSGIELSGGQSQKLAIARAIYKNAPIVVLDEPTAALDPFAEFEIYSKFNELVGGKTAIYISHRLSSCKFCDNIAVFKNGEIVEYGNHDELVNEHGLYEEMYMAQAQYYV